MTPLFFGDRTRRLFGVYSPGHAVGARARGAVLCAPWGPEYLRAHRSLAQLGKWLNEAGVHVLRFDWHGTGDSAGDMAEARLDGWVDDLHSAIDELKDTAGLQRVSLVGLRLGATLALRAAATRRRDIDGLVLWDPVMNGREHLAELRALHAATLGLRGLQAGPQELLGFAVSEALANVAKHARATTVDVTLRGGPGWAEAVVTDDGIGGASIAKGHGLAGLERRLAGVQGTLRVDSPDGGPTTLVASVPLTGGR